MTTTTPVKSSNRHRYNVFHLEKAFLGVALRAKNPWLLMLAVDDFYRPSHRVIVQAMLKLIVPSRRLTVRDVGQELARTNRLASCGGYEYLYEIRDTKLTEEDLPMYLAYALRDKGRLRRIEALQHEVIHMIHEGGLNYATSEDADDE